MQGTSAFLERVISTAREREQLTLQNFPRNQPISKFEVGQVRKKVTSTQHSDIFQLSCTSNFPHQ